MMSIHEKAAAFHFSTHVTFDRKVVTFRGLPFPYIYIYIGRYAPEFVFVSCFFFFSFLFSIFPFWFSPFFPFCFLYFNKLRLGAEFKSRCPFIPTIYISGGAIKGLIKGRCYRFKRERERVKSLGIV